jgi:hypothetical protein
MTLDDRIKKDLEDLYNKGEIDGAKDLDDLVKTDKSKYSNLQNLADTPDKQKTLQRYMMDQTSFATRALPVYDGGKRDAKTVMVMLNPGNGVENANRELLYELKKRNMSKMFKKLSCGNACPQVGLNNNNLTGDIKNYNDFNANYGDWDRWRMDNFDLKQAFFLRHWINCEVGLDETNLKYILDNKSSTKKEVKAEVHKRQLEEKRKVLMEKRQLELVPYASRSFSSINKKNISKIFPYVETLLHEIFSYDRTYVIFCSAKFEEVFQAYSGDKQYPGTIKFIYYEEKDNFKGSKLTVSCSVIRINYDNKSIKAIIANTFPNQALPNAYDLMAAYGEFCYNCLLKHLP